MEIITLVFLGFASALLGTIAMTISQEIEIKIRKRPISHTPAIAAFKFFGLDFEQVPEHLKITFSYAVHFGYGTVWGFLPALLYFFNITDFSTQVSIFFLVIWIQGLVIIPLLKVAGPPWTWGTKALLIELFHKLIYSFGTIFAFLYLLEKFL